MKGFDRRSNSLYRSDIGTPPQRATGQALLQRAAGQVLN